ncbi:hypothetical protein BGCPKDLD_2423 [Methylorubrum suomiense]|uniref:Uncharacterized protein n=1 Tax=Methylorubrum suomiense TaxID=144191 RepID=A0ABQ4UU93_9HYPH|nr:hypothetical protein BGCPKDLD_2423 [Methylorubrum suomiense]
MKWLLPSVAERVLSYLISIQLLALALAPKTP